MKENIALISVLANLGLAISKITVGILIKSSAIMADGLHSGMDIVASGIGYVGIKVGNKPADKEHPYGHYKIEVLTGFLITIILAITGIGIIYESFQTFLTPNLIVLSYLAIGLMVFSAIVNAIMSKVKIYYGKKQDSLSLLADGFHSKIDVYTSIVVLIGLILSQYWIYADAFMALFIGIFIIKGAFSLGKEATDSLLDTSASEEIEQKIKAILLEQKIDLADLKTQKKGAIITANMEINLPNELIVETATNLCTKLRELLIRNIENLHYIAIQIKSHEVTTSFYKHSLQKGVAWSKRGKFTKEIEGAKGMGPGDDCICPKCGYTIDHKRGIPCMTLICPKCNLKLTRK